MNTEVWLYSGDAAWHFASVPKKTSDIMRDRFGALSQGWGLLPVMATIGATQWKTSVFPDKKAGAYLLPIKAKVRTAEHIAAGNTVTLELRVLL
jgi:hypothetical protein